MKKRFNNILLKSKKKNGFFILVCAVSITVFLGMMTGCSTMEPSTSETQRDNENPSEQINDNETLNKEPADDANNPEEALSEDGQEIKNIAENFAAAYFNGDTDTIQSYLTNPYEWDIDVYTGLNTAGAGTVSEFTLKGLTDIGKEELGSTQAVSLEFRDSNYEDMFIYLTIEFVKQEEGWKIQFYGLEG